MRVWPGCVRARRWLLFAVSTVLVLAGGVAWLLAAGTPARVLWIAGTVLGLVFAVSWVAGAIRRHQPSVDVIAVLALAGAWRSASRSPAL